MPRGSGGGRSRSSWGRSGNSAKKDSFFHSLRWGSIPSTAEDWKSLFNSMVAKPMAAAIACKIMFMNVFKKFDQKAVTGIQVEAKKAASS